MEKLHETDTVLEAVARESLLLPSRTRTGRASEQAERLQPFQIWKHWGKEVHCLQGGDAVVERKQKINKQQVSECFLKGQPL